MMTITTTLHNSHEEVGNNHIIFEHDGLDETTGLWEP
mgnify:CR=1 FL=1